MPTNLEIYQLLKRQEAALEQIHADLQGYIACRPMSDSIAIALKLQCSGILLRLDDLRAMLKRFRVLYRIKEQYRFYLGLEKEANGPYFEKSDNGDYYAVIKSSQRPYFTIQGHVAKHFEPVIVEEN